MKAPFSIGILSRTSVRMTVALTATAISAVLLASPQSPVRFMPVAEITPGMVGVGRTIFAGDTQEEFNAHILGVLSSVVAPGRDLILARLEGGRLATTGVMQGMSGSPVYIDGRLIGAVAYSLGTFPREPIAGITPIAEMIDAINTNAPQPRNNEFALSWPATPDEAFGALGRVVSRATTPLRSEFRPAGGAGSASLTDWALKLRPIGAAIVASGLGTDVEARLRDAISFASGDAALTTVDRPTPPNGTPTAPAQPALRPGDAVGMTFMRGDMEMGATGTVTHIDGAQVYAFGHAFLNQGPTRMAMTRARVLTVVPSLDSSMRIGAMGPVMGRMTQDRATGVGGTLGPGPDELAITLTIESSHAPTRRLQFHVLHDESLTPLYAYVALFNSLGAYERQSGVTSITARGTVTYDQLGSLTIEDAFTGPGAVALASASVMNPIGTMAINRFEPALPRTLDMTLEVSEIEDYATIDRVWLDTTRPTLGGTHLLHVRLRRYRGAAEVVTIPVTMPTQAAGPITVLVSDGPTLAALEQSQIAPAAPTSIEGVMDGLRTFPKSNHLYVRLLSDASGVAVDGRSLPSLPSSVQAALDADASVAATALSRAVIGKWDRRMPRVIRGSRELTFTLRPATSSPPSAPQLPRIQP